LTQVYSVKPVVAAFDFDGTITTKDTFIPYLKKAFGKRAVYLALFSLVGEAIKVGVGISNRDSFKEKIVAKLFVGQSLDKLQAIGKEHAKEIERWFRPAAIKKIHWHNQQGHRLIMVSASLDLYLEPMAKRLGFDELLCTRLSAKNNVLSGRLLGANCRGIGKTVQLELLVGPLAGVELYAYGDSAGDKEMLEAAMHPFFKPFIAN